MIIITKATKSKSQKQFQHGVRTGFFSTTGAGEASQQGRRSPRPPTPLSWFDQAETLNTSEAPAISLPQGSDPRSPGRRPDAGGVHSTNFHQPRARHTCLADTPTYETRETAPTSPQPTLGPRDRPPPGISGRSPSSRMHRPLKAPEGRESQNQLGAPGRTACCDWRTFG